MLHIYHVVSLSLLNCMCFNSSYRKMLPWGGQAEEEKNSSVIKATEAEKSVK